ncbi:MAG TPA: ribosome silencing factor [Saprospiraceae bacterium]|nr:ribosome silencing factor [Saprospiraceae bacterium]HUN16387.1 ribosome silencing factor [Saprospiraceae bacterium]
MPKVIAKSKKTENQESKFIDLIIDSIQDIKGKNIIHLDLTELKDAPAKHFIICEGESNTQIKAIAGNVQRRAKAEALVKYAHIEGTLAAKWVLVDFFDVVVHVFDKEARFFYDLEELWADAKQTEYKNI